MPIERLQLVRFIRLGLRWTISNLHYPGVGVGVRNVQSSFRHPYAVLPALIHTSRSQFSSTDVDYSGTQIDDIHPLKDRSDRINKFYDPMVQLYLRQLIGCDTVKVFRKRKVGQKLREPKFSFMTEEQLIKSFKESEEKAQVLLQMPPVLPARKDKERILAFDPEIQGYDHPDNSTILMMDLTLNRNDRDRIVVAREPDGTLRDATWDERTKLNKIYFPTPGREIRIPKMFTDVQILKQVLERASETDNTYEFVLDRACLQFEPDDPNYISVVEYIYGTVDNKGHYDFLHSTRHYGPLVFYLVRTRRMDNLLMHYIKNERISSDATALISLFQLVFPESESKSKLAKVKSPETDDTTDADIKLLRSYIEYDAIKRNELELALNSYVENKNKKREFEVGLHRAHGM